jgi:hypothetical protein
VSVKKSGGNFYLSRIDRKNFTPLIYENIKKMITGEIPTFGKTCERGQPIKKMIKARLRSRFLTQISRIRLTDFCIIYGTE